ncbi:MAG: ABC transporter permease [Clostridia bacterium]|nr:ABC transporter permease [Clostridia bacterium]
MASEIKNKSKREPLLHIVKRDDMAWWAAWSIRILTILIITFIMCLISVKLTGYSLPVIFEKMFRKVFGMIELGRLKMFWAYLESVAILLCLSLALTPAFKMKFWNCGAEGQALMGGLAAMICMKDIGGKIPEWLLFVLMVVLSIVFGMVWGVLPAIFKAFFNTNETLFTLMMNYIAIQIVKYYLCFLPDGSNKINPETIKHGMFPGLGQNNYFVNIAVVAVLTIVMFIYLKYSKQGYEISVVGESQNTARYIGINVKKVIIRTMLISGALCGVAGLLLVAGADHAVDTNTIGGQGFTAIMMAWLGQFNPFIILFMVFVIKFIELGMVSVYTNLDVSFAEVIVAIIILCVVGCEFFIRYSVKFNHRKKEGTV